jgi:myo-inositol-1(or 4)-monophosphatase
MSGISEKVLPILYETRALTFPNYGTAEVTHKKSELANDVVTKVDTDVEKFLEDRLKVVDTGAGFYGEEFGHRGDKDRFWICDPVDGTACFVRGIPVCTTMLALIEDGKVIFSAVYDFVRDELYHAELGRGAYLNGKPIQVSKRVKGEWYVAWETHLDKKENLDTFVRLRDLAGLVKFMCSGYEQALVACGKLDARIVFDGWGKDWDYAPGTLLVSEAGGMVANIGKSTYDYKNHDFLIANREIYSALTEGPDPIFPIRDK